MKENIWIKCSDEMPDDYDWVLVRNSRKDYPMSDAIAFARRIEHRWEFFDTNENKTYGPYHGDSFGEIFLIEIDEWMYVSTWGNNEN